MSGRFISIRYRILTVFISSILLGIVALIIFSSIALNNMAKSNAEKQLLETSLHYYKIIHNLIDENMAVLLSLKTIALMFKNTGNFDRFLVEDYLRDALTDFPEMDSFFLMLEPNVFDDLDSEYTDSTVGAFDSGQPYLYVYFEDGVATTSTEGGDVGENVVDDFALDVYMVPKNTHKAYLSNPYFYDFIEYSANIVTLSVPIIDGNGKFLGIAGADFQAQNLFDELNHKIYETGYLTVTSNDNKVVYSPDGDLIGKDAPTEFTNMFLENTDTAYQIDYGVNLNGKKNMVLRMPLTFQVSDQVYCISVIAPEDEVFAASNVLILGILIALALTGLIMSIVITAYIRRKMYPLVELANISNKISQGELDVSMPNTTNDEIGILSSSFGIVINTIHNILDDINFLSKEHNQGNIDALIDAEKYNGSFKEVAVSSSNMALDYAQMLNEIIGCLENYANGNFNAEIKSYPGKKVAITNALNLLYNNLDGVSSNVSKLIRAASKGDLSARLDDKTFHGDWQALILDLNELMDTISQPIMEITSVLTLVSKGQFSEKVKGDYRGQFLVVKNAMNNTIDSIAGYIREISRVLNEMSNNNLRQTIVNEYVGEFSLIKNSLNLIINNFNNILMNIGATANQLSDGSKLIAENTNEIGTGSREQSDIVDTLRSLLGAVNQSAQTNLDNTASAKTIIEKSQNSISKGSNEMSKLVQSMDELTVVSNSINNIVKVIDSIAFQTNILAINAAIEASRAGIYGRGFEVVANEVKSLAQKSIESSKEIEVLISQAVDKITTSTENANTTNSVMQEIIGVITNTNNFIDTIVDSAKEQVQSTESINLEIELLVKIANTNASATEQLIASTEQLASQAEMLSQTANDFEVND